MTESTGALPCIEEESTRRREFWREAWQESDRRPCALWLWAIRGVGIEHLRRLIERNQLVELFSSRGSHADTILESAGMPDAPRTRVLETRPDSVPNVRVAAADLSESDGIRVCAIGDEEYPARLYDLEEPPAFLFWLGDLEATRRVSSLAVVGSRKIPARAGAWVDPLVGGTARRGIAIVSGGALGADAMAHRAALSEGGVTVGVMPCGLDQPRPKTNSPLFRKIVRADGVLVSEYPPGTGVRSYHYPRRNRLIAALGDATLVLRAGSDSGTMLTARAARSIDRPLGAVPGRPGDTLTAGCHAILADDGKPVTSVSDILERLLDSGAAPDGSDPDAPSEKACDGAGTSTTKMRPPWPKTLSREADRLLRDLVESETAGDLRTSIDAIAREYEILPGQIQSAVLEWELAGIVERTTGGGEIVVRLPECDE